MGEERIIPGPPRYLHREGEILNELPNALGLVLWQDLRHLRDWTDSPSEVRSRLFNPPTVEVHAKRRDARACAAELITALDTFASLKANPLTANPRDIGRACEQVVSWALEHEHTRIAIEWAEVAALVEPTNPKSANVAGRVTRNANEYDRSEIWFKRGIGLARAQGNTIEKFWGHVGYGKLYKELGRVKDARKHLNRASRLAWKAGPPTLAASAQHDICALLMVRGYLSEAAQHARLALHWYPQSDPRLPFFGADIALMLVLSRRYAPAARVLRPVLRAVQQPSARAVIFALAARAFAGAGEAEEAAVMRKRALKLLYKHPSLEAIARWHLADAFRLAGNWEGAQAEAESALAIATAQNDGETARMNRMLLDLITRRQPAPPRRADDVRDFVRELSERVARWSPRRGRQPGPWGVGRAA
jgi:tetratricopeptide (TPR) repeat protein